MNEKYVEISKLVESLEAVAYSDSRPDSYFSGGFREGLRKAVRMLRDEPAADVAPVVHAKWRKDNDTIVCSSCGFAMFPLDAYKKGEWPNMSVANFGEKRYVPRFCPDCGAKMDVKTP